MIGMPFIGRIHSGADDARNIARLVCKMIRAGVDLRVNSDKKHFDALNWYQNRDKKDMTKQLAVIVIIEVISNPLIAVALL